MATAVEELDEFGFEFGEMSSSVAYVSQSPLEQCLHVAARRAAVVADTDHTGYLGEREPCGLGPADESQAGERGVVVNAVSVLGPLGVRQETLALVEPNGSGRDPECVGKLPDQHVVDRTPKPSSERERHLPDVFPDDLPLPTFSGRQRHVCR